MFLMTSKKIEITHANHSAPLKSHFDKNAHVQPERLHFYFAFYARHYPW